MVGEDYEYYMTETNYDQAYYIYDKLSRGRVEICKGGEYHTISTDLWDKSDASVVCRELGFSPHAEKAKCYVTTNSYNIEVTSLHYYGMKSQKTLSCTLYIVL